MNFWILLIFAGLFLATLLLIPVVVREWKPKPLPKKKRRISERKKPEPRRAGNAATPRTPGERVELPELRFAVNSPRLDPESSEQLAPLAASLKDEPAVRIRIEGHTDDFGSPEANLWLSERRAEAVRDMLIEVFAIEAGRITAVGFGATQPVLPNNTPEARARNRRVEIVRLDG